MDVSTNDLILEQKQFQEQTSVPTVEEILKTFIQMQANAFDMSILKRFYRTGLNHPLDTAPWCLPILHGDMIKQFELDLTRSGFRKKLGKLERYGLIKKLPRTNPSVYEPFVEKSDAIKKAIVLWLVRRDYQTL